MSKLPFVLLYSLVVIAGCHSAPTGEAPGMRNGMVATAHPVATDAALEVLKQGGNAADAAVAAGFALAVVEPSMSNLGGRTQIFVRSPDGSYRGYNGMTEVPSGYTPPEEPVSQGYGTIATPGVVAGLAQLHAEHGSLSWSALLEEPARIARDGFELLPGAAARHENGLENFRDNPGFQQYFIEDDGTTYDAGDRLTQPALARTISRLAEAGADDFYRGEIAQQIAADMAANGGHVTADDLAAYKVLDGRYITTSYRGYDIHSLAAPAGGGLVVKALNILENFDMAALTDVQWAAVVNQALALTINSMTDDRAEADLGHVVDKAWAAEQAALIRVPATGTLTNAGWSIERNEPVLDAATDWSGDVWGQDSHHTTHFTIADCEGRVVSITQTVGPLFGSRVITPELGFVYAATMGSYLSAADQEPGSRPRTTIAPTVVTRDGEVVLALGAAGGIRILSAIVQTISRHVDQGHDPVTAVALPRVHPGQSETATGERTTLPETINLELTPERGWPAGIDGELRAAGFETEAVERHAAFGRVHLVALDGNAWQGVADPDWEGTSAGTSCALR
ncbi:MAG: gamma-glutamyltransferase [Gammaproteobacteria bacterium]|nr:gamma-glutamyltransferase [Gammaproteobacteria bacterium]